MAEFDRKEIILIFTFWIFCPTLDMVTDMNMAYRLFRGPSPDLWVSGGMSDKVNEIKHCNAFASCSDQLPRNLILARYETIAQGTECMLYKAYVPANKVLESSWNCTQAKFYLDDRQTHRYFSCS